MARPETFRVLVLVLVFWPGLRPAEEARCPDVHVCRCACVCASTHNVQICMRACVHACMCIRCSVGSQRQRLQAAARPAYTNVRCRSAASRRHTRRWSESSAPSRWSTGIAPTRRHQCRSRYHTLPATLAHLVVEVEVMVEVMVESMVEGMVEGM